jgi:hypothetical protein
LVEVALVVVVTCNSSCNGSNTEDTAITTITRKYKGLFIYGFEFKGLIYTLTEFFKLVHGWDRSINTLHGYDET